MSMGTKIVAQVAAAAALCVALSAVPASAKEHKMRHARHMHMSKQTVYRPLTVAGMPTTAPVAAAPYSPFSGPVPFVTGPVAIAGTVIGLPFRALAAIFPSQGSFSQNPLIVVGRPAALRRAARAAAVLRRRPDFRRQPDLPELILRRRCPSVLRGRHRRPNAGFVPLARAKAMRAR